MRGQSKSISARHTATNPVFLDTKSVRARKGVDAKDKDCRRSGRWISLAVASEKTLQRPRNSRRRLAVRRRSPAIAWKCWEWVFLHRMPPHRLQLSQVRMPRGCFWIFLAIFRRCWDEMPEAHRREVPKLFQWGDKNPRVRLCVPK